MSQVALERFHTDELVRFYDSQRKHGKAYLQATLNIWKQNSQSGAYAKGLPGSG